MDGEGISKKRPRFCPLSEKPRIWPQVGDNGIVKVLLVEDDPSIASVVSRGLGDAGFTDSALEFSVFGVQCCWDADRLDLGRVGIRACPDRLCTAAGRTPKIIEWAWLRSRSR